MVNYECGINSRDVNARSRVAARRKLHGSNFFAFYKRNAESTKRCDVSIYVYRLLKSAILKIALKSPFHARVARRWRVQMARFG